VAEYSRAGSVRLRLLNEAVEESFLYELGYPSFAPRQGVVVQIEPPLALDVVRAEVEVLLREGRVALYEPEWWEGNLDEFLAEYVEDRADDREFVDEERPALSLEEALAAIADETSWIPGGRSDHPLALAITESGYEEYLRDYPPSTDRDSC
jgi:hypothetical protein